MERSEEAATFGFEFVPLEFGKGLAAIEARANPKFVAEGAAKVRGIVESPGKRNFGNAAVNLAQIGQIVMTLAEALRANPVRDGTARVRENAVNVAHGNAECGCNRRRRQVVFREVAVNVTHHTRE